MANEFFILLVEYNVVEIKHKVPDFITALELEQLENEFPELMERKEDEQN